MDIHQIERINDFHTNLLFPSFAKSVYRFLERVKKDLGIYLRITESIRSLGRQKELFDYGRKDLSKPIVTNAKPGLSRHHYGIAIDVWLGARRNGRKGQIGADEWEKIALIGQEEGLVAGHFFTRLKDSPHFEMRTQITPSQMFDSYEKTGLRGVWHGLMVEQTGRADWTCVSRLNRAKNELEK